MATLPASHERKAGRELDALVAEKVMGWRWIATVVPGSGKAVLLHPPEKVAQYDPRYIALFECPGHVGGPFPSRMPHYSEDIAAAWLVVEKMGDYCCDFTLERAGASWYADFRVGSASGPTPQLAICLAALSAPSAVNISEEKNDAR